MAKESLVCDQLSLALGIEPDPYYNPVLSLDDLFQEGNHDRIPSPFKGKKHTDETRKIMSDINKGKTFSEDTLYKMRIAKLGKKMSDEARHKMSVRKRGVNNSFYGRKHSEESIERIKIKTRQLTPWNKGVSGIVKISEETKHKLSEIHRGRLHTEESKLKMSESRKLYWEKKKNEKS